MANQQNSSVDKVALGGYILEDCDGNPELILIGTGTELDLCVQAAKQLTKEGRKAVSYTHLTLPTNREV